VKLQHKGHHSSRIRISPSRRKLRTTFEALFQEDSLPHFGKHQTRMIEIERTWGSSEVGGEVHTIHVAAIVLF
jgi:hypothetical protein